MTQRGGLGRGLAALIPHAESGVAAVDVGLIRPNVDQPRLTIEEAALRELASSIAEHGVLQPLIVTRVDDSYVLVAGERRWRAAQLAGLRTVPVLVRETTPGDRMLLALVENLQREDLSPLEQAAAYRQLLDEHGLDQEQLAKRVGKSRTAVANTLRLLNLPEQGRQALAAGEITEGHARALLGCERPEQLLSALSTVVEKRLNVRQTEELVRRAVGRRENGETTVRAAESGTAASPSQPLAPPQAPDADLLALEDRLRAALGTRVQLFRSRRGGKLVIHFYDDEQLEGLYRTITGEGADPY